MVIFFKHDKINERICQNIINESQPEETLCLLRYVARTRQSVPYYANEEFHEKQTCKEQSGEDTFTKGDFIHLSTIHGVKFEQVLHQKSSCCKDSENDICIDLEDRTMALFMCYCLSIFCEFRCVKLSFGFVIPLIPEL